MNLVITIRTTKDATAANNLVDALTAAGFTARGWSSVDCQEWSRRMPHSAAFHLDLGRFGSAVTSITYLPG